MSTTLRRNLAIVEITKTLADHLKDTLADAYAAVELLAPDGHSSGHGNGGRPAGTHSDPTGNAIAEAYEDNPQLIRYRGLLVLHEDMCDAIMAGLESLKFARECATQLASKIADKANPEPVGQGWCRAHCGHWCPGTSSDRLRQGLCDACRKWRSRNEIADLSDVAKARRGNEGKCNCDDCKHLRDVSHQPREVA